MLSRGPEGVALAGQERHAAGCAQRGGGLAEAFGVVEDQRSEQRVFIGEAT